MANLLTEEERRERERRYPKPPVYINRTVWWELQQDKFNVLHTPATRRSEAWSLARVQTASRPSRHTKERVEGEERCGAETQQRRSMSKPCLDIVPLKAQSGRDEDVFPNCSQEPSICERVFESFAASQIGP